MNYIWFWTFWHWSKEGFRRGAVLRDALHGIGGHWDEWFGHEASDGDRRTIEEIGRTEMGQRKFIYWLCRYWIPEAIPNRNRLISRFILGQLARVPPFNTWPAFARFRRSYGLEGIKAIVLAESSAGQPQDIRNIEALILPRDGDATSPELVPEEFQAEATDLQPALQSAKQLLSGKGLLIFLTQWVLRGRRPYPRWLTATLVMGWLALVGLILMLMFGPDPGSRLFLVETILVGLWVGLILVEAGVAGVVALRAGRSGMVLRQRLENSQVRLRMNGGLTLKGGSAGVPFCLNILSSLYRAFPNDTKGSWLLQQAFRKLCSAGHSCAATGALTADGRLKQVVLEPKIRACLKEGGIQQLLTPNQPEATESAIEPLAKVSPASAVRPVPAASSGSRVQFGFAAEKPGLRVHRCNHVANAVLVLGGFIDRWRVVANILLVTASAVMLTALPDLRSVLLPHAAPVAVPPASPTPYDLWVSMSTKHPQYFSVVLESDYWSNRRAEVKRYEDPIPSVRAEIPFHRLTGLTSANEDDGIVWIERRHRFLGREFLPGERVGRYTIPYLTHLGHE